MKRMASVTLETTPSSVRCTRVRSSDDDVGVGERDVALQLGARDRVLGRAPARRTSAGARSSTPGSNTTKKFGWNRAQLTWRRLATRVSTGTPCTFQVTPVADADARLGRQLFLDRDPRQLPLPGGRRSTTIRRSAAPSSPAYRGRCCDTPAAAPSGLRRREESAVRESIGAPVHAGHPRRHDRRERRAAGRRGRASSRATLSFSSTWMSKNTRLGRSGRASSANCSTRLRCTTYSVVMRKTPKPIASTTATVWFCGRNRLAIPWRTT